MALNPIVPGLRRMVNPSHDVAKVALVVAAGAELDVPPAVAEQLERQGFREAPPSVPTFTNAPDPAEDEVVERVKAQAEAGDFTDPKPKGKKG